ncbi:hypothetical protein HH212_15265 [Massilia forsythiae]|uniref:Uncharacterized protein n=1 Tax=Massilia forsythiae TaxID=2728020 RepID=A0A7Z2ZT55_9BURK|nr:hypothetical protein [Massilia forsythiae]QJE01226.1 hypothetical protein HH212_15265 [Massilia forsythiae]
MATAQAQEAALPSPPQPTTAGSVGGISDAAIKEAVRAALADEPKAASGDRGPALSGDRHREFSRQFSEAEKPSCLGPDALKHQPAEFRTKTWVFGLGGVLALPFWGAAIVRGKCN